MENTSGNNPVTRILAVMLLVFVGGVLVFGGVGAWMLGTERIWTLAQFITGGLVTIMVASALALVIFSTSFPIRARTRGPDQAMTTISNVTHRYEGTQLKEKEIHYGEPASSNRVLTSGPYPNPPFLVTGGGNFDSLPLQSQNPTFRLESSASVPENAPIDNEWEAEA